MRGMKLGHSTLVLCSKTIFRKVTEFCCGLLPTRGANFGTCVGGYEGVEDDGDHDEGMAQVNRDIVDQFALGARLLRQGECSMVQTVKTKIVDLLTIPLIQVLFVVLCSGCYRVFSLFFQPFFFFWFFFFTGQNVYM
jgi:hypothetical protein